MHSIHLNDHVYTMAQQLASARGHKSVEDYITEVVEEEMLADTENFDHLFTPEVMAGIAEGVADAEAGRTYTLKEALEQVAEWKKEWRNDQAR